MRLRELLQQITDTANEIGSSKPFICGGAPRDKYMGRLDNLSDIDITTGDESAKQLSSALIDKLSQKYNIQTNEYKDHTSINIGNVKLDFSSNYTIPGVHHYLTAKNIDPTPMRQEIYSRDFTCNALLLTFDLKNIIDITGRGKIDIDNKIIKTCMSPRLTLTSSKNRVIRSIYMAIKLGFEIDSSIIEFVRQNPLSLKIGNIGTIKNKLEYCMNKDPDKTNYLLKAMNLIDIAGSL